MASNVASWRTVAIPLLYQVSAQSRPAAVFWVLEYSRMTKPRRHTMQAIFYTHDLMISSQATAAARSKDCDLQVIRSLEQVREQLSRGGLELAILDLESPGIDVPAVVNLLKSEADSPRVVAFGPHVWTERLQAAEASGCDQVLSRGQLVGSLHEIFAASS